jgi:hypothetical protein
MRQVTGVLMVAGALVLAACGGDEQSEKKSDEKVAVQFSPDTKEVAAENDGDVKIRSTDGALVLAVVGDSVVIQLSDSLRQSVADSIKKGTGDKGGVGAIIGNAVSAAVNTAMGFKVRVPAKDVENLRYENGELHFEVHDGAVNINSGETNSGKTNGGKTNGGKFSEEDARRFIDAVKAAQGKQPAM